MGCVCNHLCTAGDAIYFLNQLKYNCNAFMLKNQLNSTYRMMNIDDPCNYRVLKELIAQTMKAPLLPVCCLNNFISTSIWPPH